MSWIAARLCARCAGSKQKAGYISGLLHMESQHPAQHIVALEVMQQRHADMSSDQQ